MALLGTGLTPEQRATQLTTNLNTFVNATLASDMDNAKKMEAINGKTKEVQHQIEAIKSQLGPIGSKEYIEQITNITAISSEIEKKTDGFLKNYLTTKLFGATTPEGKEKALTILSQYNSEQLQGLVRNQPQSYTCQVGDTLAKISEKYAIPEDILRRANIIGNTGDVTLGQEIIIPLPQLAQSGSHEGPHKFPFYVLYPDGTLYYGGTKPWRNNNPGSLVYGYIALRSGAIGSDSGGFAIFPDRSSGETAMKRLFQESKKYGGKTLVEVMYMYADPKRDNVEEYIQYITDATTIKKTDIVSDLPDSQLKDLIDSIIVREGTVPGETYSISDGPPWVEDLGK